MFKSLLIKMKSNTRLANVINVGLIVFLSLYVFSIPAFSGRAKLYLISYALMAILGLLIAIKYILYEKFSFDRRLLIVFLFVVEALIGTIIYSHEFRHWLTIALLFITCVIFYYSFCAIDKSRLVQKIIAYSLLVFGLYFAFHYRGAILKFNLDNPLGRDFDNVNTVGTYFSLGSSLFLYLALSADKKLGLLYVIPCGFMLFLGLFTGSRHFIITTGITFIATIFVAIKTKKWIALLVIAGVIAMFFAGIQLPQLAPLKERINRGLTTLFGIGNSKYDPSAVQRTIWPQYGYNLGSKVLLFGYGAEGFSIYSGIGTYSHNTYSEIICNFGLFGTLIFYTAFVLPLFLAIRSRKRSLSFIIVVVTFYIVKGFFGVYFASKDAYLMIALIMYLAKDIRLGNYVGFGVNSIAGNSYCEVNI